MQKKEVKNQEIKKSDLLKVEIVESEKYVGSDWCQSGTTED